MFGVLKGTSCSLSTAEKKHWLGHICGTCVSLQSIGGLPARITTNYDAALLSVLFDALAPQPQTKRSSYCPLRPSAKVEIVAADNPGVKFAAAMALWAAASKIRDHLLDQESYLKYTKMIAKRVADQWERRALATTAPFGFDGAMIGRQVRHQIAVEAQPHQDFLFYARPTELAVGAAFGQIAMLANCEHNIDIMRELGHMFGRIMYLLDSYTDYVADLAANKFNALANAYAETEKDYQVRKIFQEAHHVLKKRFYQLDLQHAALLEPLLIKGLQKKGYRTLQICGRMPMSCQSWPAQTNDADITKLQFGNRQFASPAEDPQQQKSCQCSFWDCCCYCDCCDCVDCCEYDDCSDCCCDDSVCSCCECTECICGDLDCCCPDCCGLDCCCS